MQKNLTHNPRKENPMTITTVTPPNGEPVSLAEARAFLRIGHDGEDALVQHLLEGARARLEQASGLALVSRTVRQNWRSWPAALRARGIPLRPGPVQNIISIKEISASGEETDLTARFLFDAGRQRLCLPEFAAAPLIPPGGQVEVTYIAGFGAPEDVPADLKQAVLRLALDTYRRGETEPAGAGLPRDVEAIIKPYRQVRL